MIGGGAETSLHRRAGWHVLDGDATVSPDTHATIPPLPSEITNQEWDIICAIHFIEHLFLDDAEMLMREVYHVLKPGGKLVLEQANLTWVCKAILGDVVVPTHKYPWAKGEERWFTLFSLYPQPHQLVGNELQLHKYGYTPETLTELVHSCGWGIDQITIGHARTHVRERDFRLEAVK
jgi:predicted SAM-dependent methyltransferase